MFHISFVFLPVVIFICTLHAKFQQKKMHACKAAAGEPLLEILYIPLLPVMTPHYHRLYQISSLAANLSLEVLKQLCIDRGHLHRYTYLPQN